MQPAFAPDFAPILQTTIAEFRYVRCVRRKRIHNGQSACIGIVFFLRFYSRLMSKNGWSKGPGSVEARV
jgi:hypothetical protein